MARRPLVKRIVRVTADYQAPFPDPIRVQAGEQVGIDRGKTTNIPGWLWCAGRSGWVPEAYLEVHGQAGVLACDYDAIELTVHVGEVLTVSKEQSGFFWVTDPAGRQGWVPADHTEAV